MTDHLQQAPESHPLSRRRVMSVGSTVVGLAAVGALAACGSDDPETEPTAGADSTTPAATPSTTPLAKVSEIPAGSAVKVEGPDGPLIIARPAEGAVVAFSAKCTHKGCPVVPDGAVLNCPCHGAKFEALTGKLISGPESSMGPLAPFTVTESGDDVIAG